MTRAESIIMSFASFRSNLSSSILSNSSLWIALDKEWLHIFLVMYMFVARIKSVAVLKWLIDVLSFKRDWILCLIKDFYGLLLNWYEDVE